MIDLKSYRYRLYPTKMQDKELRRHLWIEKELWNKMLEAVKKEYEISQKFLNRNQLQLLVKNSELYSQTAQSVAHRLNKALRRIGQMRKLGKKSGFPRFKNFDRVKSLLYPQSGFKIAGKKLKVTPFGEISIKKHRELDGEVKTLTLKREPSGKWFATFCVEQEKKEPKINNGEQVGLDLGLMKFAVLSNGNIITNPRHLKQHEDKLAALQRRLSKKKKGSKNRKKAKLKVARIYEKIANTRADFLHKTSTSLAKDYSLIALEKLATQEMSEQNFGKQINDAGWNMFANMISYKAEEAGCKVIFVDPKNTTQECSECHQIVEKDLTIRIHHCPFCGMIMNRDLNAAKNMLILATQGHCGSNACGDGVIAPSLKQEAHAF